VQVVIAQRLLRRICDSCTEPYQPTAQEIEWLKHEDVHQEDYRTLRHGRGCSHCNGTGYKGRLGVYEMVEMTKPLVEAAAHHDAMHFTQAAHEVLRGHTLMDHALEQVMLGHTTVFELMRIRNQVED
jgi:MSHA biogenesis protein MshE